MVDALNRAVLGVSKSGAQSGVPMDQTCESAREGLKVEVGLDVNRAADVVSGVVRLALEHEPQRSLFVRERVCSGLSFGRRLMVQLLRRARPHLREDSHSQFPDREIAKENRQRRGGSGIVVEQGRK